MGVGAEIAQHMFRSAEGRLGVDDPVVAEQYAQPGGEGTWLRQVRQVAMELKLTPSAILIAESDFCPRFRSITSSTG